MRGELGIAWANIRRNVLRNLLLLLTTAIGFLLYGVLGTSTYSMSGGSDELAKNRLMVLSRAGLTRPLPLSYAQRLESIDGIDSVSHATWFGLYFRDRKNSVLSFAVDPEGWVDQHHEMILSEEDADRFFRTRNGILAARSIAERYGWRVGDLIPLKSVLFDNLNENHWSFELAGVFRTDERAGGRNYIIAHYDYLNRNRGFWNDTVGTFLVMPEDVARAGQVASRIDAHFGRSSIPTFTTTDQAFHVGFFEQVGDLFFLMESVLLVSFVSIVMVMASTLALTVRQRVHGIAVLKTLGYSNSKVLRIVYLETLGLSVAGGLLGLSMAAAANELLISRFTIIPDINLPPEVTGQALLLMLSIGVISGLIPAFLALRLKPAEAFRVHV